MVMMGRILAVSFMVVLATHALGCGSTAPDPANLAGSYEGPVVNGSSSCAGLWNTGQMAEVPITVVQNQSTVSLQVTGAAALVLGAQVGAAQFNGTIQGSHVDALLVGSAIQTLSDCKYTWNGHLVGDVDANVLSGTVTYTPVTNGSPDCSANVTGCSRQQTFAWTRQTAM